MEEAAAVAEVVNAHSVADFGVEDTSPEDVRASWERPDRDLHADLIVAEGDGRIVAYLEVDARAPWTSLRIDGYVHPHWWGRGIGSELLRRGETRARELGGRAARGEGVFVYHGVWRGSAGGPLLEASGYRLTRVFWKMAIDLSEPPPRAQWPPGIAVRTPRPGEEAAVHAAIDEAFADHWEHRPSPFDHWYHEHRSRSGFDPMLWFLAVDGQDIVGGAICRRFTSDDPDRAEVDDLGVRRPWRRRGVALALLRHAFGEFHRRGIRGAVLTVDSENPTGALRVYERAGMRVERRIDVYGKELVPGSAPSSTRDEITPEG